MILNFIKIIRAGLIFVFLFFLQTITVYKIYYANEPKKEILLKIDKKNVIYELPYPGILPDHPLYFLKIIRDRVNDFFVRDHLKKAKLYLNYSDKRAAMALSLNKKGKYQISISTFSKGEKYFEKIIDIIKQSKEKNLSMPSDFIELLKLSNSKHHELINEIMKSSPQGLQKDINQLLELNLRIKKELETIP